MPDTFTWTVDYTGPSESVFGVLAYGPPTVGSSGDFYWFRSGTNWLLGQSSAVGNSFKARVTAIPEPDGCRLVALGVVGILGCIRRRARSA